jgi:hypothetical protein
VSGSAAKPTTEIRTEVLTPDAVREGIKAHLAKLIDAFQPLPFEAASDATAWLRHHVEERTLPITTVLALDPTEDRLCGFLAMGFTTIILSSEDRPMAEVGIVGRDQEFGDLDAPQLAADISWIARGMNTQKGFGQYLFDCAVNLAIDNHAVAMVVTPHDEETARKVWVGRFRFRRPRPADQSEGAIDRLWYPVHQPDGSWPS